MKKLILLISTIICFVGCYEVNEEITINADGSGVHNTKMDMGQMLEMIQSMAGEEELAKEGLDKVLDTTILMKSVMDSAKELSAEQREAVTFIIDDLHDRLHHMVDIFRSGGKV